MKIDLDELGTMYRAFIMGQHKRLTQPRDLTDRDIVSWDDALNTREGGSTRPQTMEEVRTILRRKDPIRWRRIKRDRKWIEKQMLKLGLNPEDARFLL